MNHYAPVCPRCGEQAAVRQLQEVFAEHMALVRQAESQPPRPHTSEEPPPDTGSGTNASAEQLVVGAVMQVLLELGKTALESTVVRPAARWWQTKGQAMMRERQERLMQVLTEAIDRHPELYYCGRDDVVFLPGATHTLPTNKAVELLMKHDDVRLMSMLNP